MSDEKEVKFSDTAKYKANNKYIKENYKQVKLSMPNQEAEDLDAFLKANGIDSKAGFIREAIKEKMQRMMEESN